MHCSICNLDPHSFAGTFLVESTGRPMSKGKILPTSDRDRWIRIDDKIYERFIVCHFCYSKYCGKKDIFSGRDANDS